MMQRTYSAIVAGVLALCVLGACDESSELAPMQAKVIKGDLVFEASYYAELQAAKSEAVHVPAISNVNQLTVDSVAADGTLVKKGDVILTFVKESLEMDLVENQDRLEVVLAEQRKAVQGLARERIDLALDVQRKELALERAGLDVVQGVNFISKIDLEKAKIGVSKAKLDLKLAREALRAFEKKKASALKIEALKVKAVKQDVLEKTNGLELVQVHAPVDGMVYAPYTRLNWQRTKVAPGVVARPGDKVLELPDLSTYHAHVYVRGRDAALLSVGDEAVVEPVILSDKRIPAVLVKKEDFATTRNERLGTKTPEGSLKEYLVTFELAEAPDALKPGNSGRVSVRSTIAKDVVLVPLIALRMIEGEGYKARRVDGTWSAVRVGRTSHTMAEVLDGLSVGDMLLYPALESEKKKPN